MLQLELSGRGAYVDAKMIRCFKSRGMPLGDRSAVPQFIYRSTRWKKEAATELHGIPDAVRAIFQAVVQIDCSPVAFASHIVTDFVSERVAQLKFDHASRLPADIPDEHFPSVFG